MKILLVDDEAGIVESLAALLRALPGDEVKTATTGGQALQAAHAWGGVDLVITDVVMEPMDGFTLRDQIATRYPEARTIFVTGYDLSDYGEQTVNHQVLAKPVERGELFAAIARATLPAATAALETPAVELAPASIEEVAGIFQAEPTPAPAPVAVAVATPRVAAAAQPVAVPRVAAAVSAPGVKVVAGPKAVASPKAAVAGPKAVAAPKVAVAAAPRAVAAAVPPPSTAAARATGPVAPKLPDDEMVGQTIGAYEIQRVLGEGDWGRVYRALQASINRQVGFNLLSPSRAADEHARAQFLGDARAKAHVQHPSILAVYEAGEANGHVFYTHEYVDGRTLEQIQASGERLDEAAALKVLKTAAEGLDYLQSHEISHSPLDAGAIYIAGDNTPRLANVATNTATDPVPIAQKIQALGRIVLGVLPSIQSVSPGLRAILSRMMQAGPQALGSWTELVQALKAIEPKVIPVEAARISAQDRASTAAVEAARKAQKRSVYINVGSMISLTILGVAAVWWWLSGGFGGERGHNEMVQIPAGAFPFGNPPQQVDVGEFWIDKYEVSIGQYAVFVKALEDRPTSEFDHPKQPKIKTAEMHKPHDWAVYYGRAAAGKPIHGVASDLNMPALAVDWWDAYAYAKWKDRELPTEQEWEKAARGTQGFIYPWGNDFDPKKVNSNSDFVPTDPSAPGKVDGFSQWGPVDKQRDKSPFGVVGMAGNVAEWIGTWSKDNKFPIVKGGSFMSSDVRLDKREEKVPANTAQENLGFRTVSHKPPAK